MSKYYVSGCRDDGETIVTCEDSEATFWTLYARDDKGLSQGIIDLAFREDAEAALAVYVERDALKEQLLKLGVEKTIFSSGIGFFSYGSECGYEEHDTAEKAIEFAQAEIDDYQGNACDGWSDEVNSVVWGVIMQRATETNKRPVSEEDTHVAEHISYMCDFHLLPVIDTQATEAFSREIKAQGFTAEGV